MCRVKMNDFLKSEKPQWNRVIRLTRREIFIRGYVFLLMFCFFIPAAWGTLRLPVNAEIVGEDLKGDCWRQNARLRVTYTAALTQLKAVIGQQGWHLKQELKLGTTNDRCLLVFSSGKAEITVMVWKIGINEAGFSWGVVSDQRTAKKSNRD